MSEVLPRLGVIVLNWNGRQHLQACLGSLAKSDHPDYFVVLVDNASVDGSVEWVRENHPEVDLLALDSNRRFAGGNNAGAVRAIELGAEILFILNNDTEIRSDTLRHLGAAFAEPDVAIAGPRVVFGDDPQKIWYGGGKINLSSGRMSHRAIRESVDAGADPAGPTGWVTGCSLATRARLWADLGGLDEAFYIYSEDVDYCLRVRGVGGRIEYVPTAVVEHAVSASVGGTSSPFKAYHRTRARIQLMRRHASGSAWRFGAFSQDMAWAALLLLKGGVRSSRAVFEAWFEATGCEPKYSVDDLKRPMAADPANAAQG